MSRGPLRDALILGGVAALVAALLAGVNALTAGRIAANREAEHLRQLQQILPGDSATQWQDPMVLDSQTALQQLGTREPVRVYRMRRADRVSGVVFSLATHDGYNGDIDLLIGIRRSGALSAVRVTDHRETPGLGDGIEADKSDWIRQFRGRSLGDPPRAEWAVQPRGGEFKHLTGATITSSAVVAAIRRTLDYFQSHRGALLAP